MFSLCIPTMDRFDNYLKIFIPKYLNNHLINEIIITDENGNDVKKIKEMFPDNNKLKLYVNKKRLGPFLNKIQACKKAKNEWIALIDSDNFADKNYFNKINNFINNNNISKNSVLSPDYGTEVFQWGHLSNFNDDYGLLNKTNYKKMDNIDKQHPNKGKIGHILNLGNYVLNKFLIDNLNIMNYEKLISVSHCFDVVLMNLMFFEQFNLNFYIIKDLRYTHSISKDSVYHEFINKHKNMPNYTYDKIYNYLLN